MKTKIILSTLVIVVFVLLTFIFSKNEAKVDGYDIYGFPFTFYKYTEGKLSNPSEYAKLGFYLKFFIYDLLILVFSIFIVNYIAYKVLK
ncbi:hypothetical protein AY601_2379 [Pedobacter cryoconitis]|uniref:Uncharacterized protein n=1 Tax=Pedobacter cryoconitis TaxID=188932 RepID=A0A127VD37_9SPHI|nr:hypothetical protein AY601_2379 [Pedobacter cryoconitis]